MSEGPLSVAAAARRLGLARQSVQRVVNELRAEGLVTVSPDPADQRAPLVGLTARGREVLGRLQASSARERTRTLESTGLDAADLRHARSTMRELAAALRAGT